MTDFTLITIIALATLGGIAYIFGRYGRRRTAPDEIVTGKGDCATCTGDDPKCEQECMMEAATKPIEYFDDEELDAFKGRRSDSYTDDDVELFAYILHTMRPDEVKAWTRSLTLRGISLPDELKDEVLMLAESDET